MKPALPEHGQDHENDEDKANNAEAAAAIIAAAIAVIAAAAEKQEQNDNDKKKGHYAPLRKGPYLHGDMTLMAKLLEGSALSRRRCA